MLRSRGRPPAERRPQPALLRRARAAGEGFEPSRQPQRLPSCFQGSHVRPLRHPAEPLFKPIARQTSALQKRGGAQRGEPVGRAASGGDLQVPLRASVPESQTACPEAGAVAISHVASLHAPPATPSARSLQGPVCVQRQLDWSPGPSSGLFYVGWGIAARTVAVSTNCSKRTILPPRTMKWWATRALTCRPVVLLVAV